MPVGNTYQELDRMSTSEDGVLIGEGLELAEEELHVS